jgi:hypothetical protein
MGTNLHALLQPRLTRKKSATEGLEAQKKYPSNSVIYPNAKRKNDKKSELFQLVNCHLVIWG